MTMLADHGRLRHRGRHSQAHPKYGRRGVAATSAALEHRTVPSTPQGHDALLEMAEAHLGRRAWAIEGTGLLRRRTGPVPFRAW